MLTVDIIVADFGTQIFQPAWPTALPLKSMWAITVEYTTYFGYCFYAVLAIVVICLVF